MPISSSSNEDETSISPPHSRVADNELPLNIPRIKKNEGISGFVWSKGKAHLYSTGKQWKRYSKGHIPADAESILAVPIR